MKKIFFSLLMCLLLCSCKNTQVELTEKYYEKSEVIEIVPNDFNKLIEEKESFIISVYQPGCVTSKKFMEFIDKLSVDDNLVIYKMTWLDAKETEIYNYLKYYPSLIIYSSGKHKNYLRSDKDSDLQYYESYEDLKNWVNNKVVFKK